MNAKCQFPSESKLGTGTQPFQRAARFVAAAKLGKFPAARNRITKLLSVYVYINVMMKTVCATFSLQDNMPFPLPTENNTRNEAAAPEHKQKNPAKHGEMTEWNPQKYPRIVSAEKHMLSTVTPEETG